MIIYTRSLKCKRVDVLLVDCGYILGVVPPLMTNPPPVNSPTLHSLSLLGGVLQLNTQISQFHRQCQTIVANIIFIAYSKKIPVGFPVLGRTIRNSVPNLDGIIFNSCLAKIRAVISTNLSVHIAICRQVQTETTVWCIRLRPM